MQERALIAQALRVAGYEELEPTEANLREVGTDYADAGIWQDIADPEELQDFTAREIATALIRYCK